MSGENFAIYTLPCGRMKITYNDCAIVGICRCEEPDTGVPSELSDRAYAQLCEYFDGKRKDFDLPISARGTVFQERVWQALTKIPYGKTVSYKQLAESIGNERACRAVGGANNKNPISIVIPCHRVIGAGGELVGYGGGLDMKKMLLQIEKDGLSNADLS